MIDKIYEKDNYENQQIFHDIEQAKKYSNYSIELNQTFGDKSYEKFYKSLIEHKKARGLNLMSMFQKPKNATELKVYEEPFNIKEFKAALKTMKMKNDKLIYRIKNPYQIRHKFQSEQKEEKKEKKEETKSVNNKNDKKINNKNNINSKIKKELIKENEKIYLPEVPDVGRYNPSYDVLDKHTYKVAFSQQTFEDFNKKGIKRNSRNIFNDHTKIDYNYNDNKPLTLEMKTKFIKSKIKPIYININNMPKTYNKNDGIRNINEIKRKTSNHYETSPSLYNSLNSQLNTNLNTSPNQNISTNFEINKSTLNTNKMSDSQILIRTNGDIHSRCPKHINNYLYNTNSSLSFDDSINNTDSFNNSNSNFNSTLKNNHCLKFETYTKRKPMIKKFNYINEDFTNTEAFNLMYPPKNKNICIEFDKLSTAKEKQKSVFEVEANKNKNPPLGTYYPKYGNTFKKIIDVYIDKKCPPINNKRRLKEIMLKYDVPSNYLLFDILNKK